MLRSRKISHLSLVWDKEKRRRCGESTKRVPAQYDLGLDSFPNTITFVDKECLSQEVLHALLARVRPHLIFDLRMVPRFDFPGYSRKRAFMDFQQSDAFYLSSSGIAGERDFLPDLMKRLRAYHKKLVGPLLMIIDSEQQIDTVFQSVPRMGKKNWSISIERPASRPMH